MNVVYKIDGKEENLKVTIKDFYKTIAEKMSNESPGSHKVFVLVDNGIVEYAISPRSGTQFICEVKNTLPDKYLDKTIEDKFLTCVNPSKNSYKFYKLSVMNDEVKASYGRMGTNKGDLFGERSCNYPLSMFWIKYYEKIGKGYVDRTDVYLNDTKDVDEVENTDSKKTSSKSKSLKELAASTELFKKLCKYAKVAVTKAKVNVPVTKGIINESKKLLDSMRSSSTIDVFNKNLMDLIAILQRPVRTGDGRGVRDLMASNDADFSRILTREEDLIKAMEGVLIGDDTLNRDKNFSDYDIEVYYATDKQKQEVIAHLSDDLKKKVKNVYRVIPLKQKEIFNKYIKDNNIKVVKQLWHGSRNENWVSIIQNSLSLNPNAKITGKMFGYGIYFAPKSTKAWNYTSYSGSYWAKGCDDIAYMGLYAVAYGKPYDVHQWSGSADYKQLVKSNKCNCLHAHAGASLLNDEIVFYNESSILLNYIVEFE